jgi:carboxymethylenebutenolidase
MIEQKIDILAADGSAEALLYRPDDIGDFPGVIFLTDIWGIQPANQDVARRLADKGFAVLMPNVFYRYSRLPLLPPGMTPGSEPAKALLPKLFGALTADDMTRDGPCYVDFLLRNGAGSKLGVVGYCYTGAMALRMAAASPDKIAAAASFHGGRLVTNEADSPHRLLPDIKARLYFGHAVEDPSMTPAEIETLEAALRAWHGAFESEIYPSAHHGWTVPGRPAYNELEAERAFEKLVELLDGTLK